MKGGKTMINAKSIIFIAGFFVLTLLVSTTQAFEGTLAKGTVYFNDQKATVDNATLRIGEPFTVRAEVTTKENITVSLKLSASGFREKEKQPYEVIEGTSALNQWYDKLNVAKSTNLTFTWKLKPSDAWSGGTAPLNIDFTIHPSKGGDSETVGFTVVNAYISKDYYQGAAPTPSPFASPSASPAKSVQGFEVILLLLSIFGALVVVRRAR